MKKNYNMTAISRACNLKSQTLRAWESRYNTFAPKRDEAGNRIYSQDDYDKAILLSKLTNAGHKISHLSNLDIIELNSLLKNHSTNQNNDNYLSQILKSTEEYKIDEICNILNTARVHMNVNQYLMDLVIPLIAKIGSLSLSGHYTITQEHLISCLIRDQISQIHIPTYSNKKSSMIFATPEGNIHELSIQIASLIAKTNQVTTRYLGAAHPAPCLAQAVNFLESNTLILGVISSNAWPFEKKIIPYLKQLDKNLKKPIKIILGGASKIKIPKLANISEIVFLNSFDEFNKLTKEQI